MAQPPVINVLQKEAYEHMAMSENFYLESKYKFSIIFMILDIYCHSFFEFIV